VKILLALKFIIVVAYFMNEYSLPCLIKVRDFGLMMSFRSIRIIPTMTVLPKSCNIKPGIDRLKLRRANPAQMAEEIRSLYSNDFTYVITSILES
jgi:hypothetical protein